MIFDVLIVGAGPAGSYLAYLLASDGFSVAVLDKERFPRDKPCGGGLSRKTLSLLRFDLARVTEAKIKGALLTHDNCGVVSRDIAELAGITVCRREFDHLLLSKAESAGAHFFPKTAFMSAKPDKYQVRVDTSRQTFVARYLIGADGVGSAVRRTVFGRNVVSYAPAVEAIVPATSEQVVRIGERVLFDFGAIPHGYGWIFPKRDHFNVGVYSAFSAKHLRKRLARFVSHYASLSAPVRIFGHAIPIRNEKKIFEKDRTWLVGDAAGFAEQVYGEGIYFALKSAALAADAFAEANGEPEAGRYTALLRQHVLRELYYSELIARFFYRFPRLSFSRLVRNVHVNRYLAGLVLGTVGYRECFYKVSATLPYRLFSKRYAFSPEFQL